MKITAATFDEKVTDFFERRFANVLISVTPYAASFIPIAFLYRSLTKTLDIHPAVAAIISLAAEGIGVASVAIYNRAVQWNKRYTKEANHVDTRPAIIAYVIYLSAIITTSAILEASQFVPEAMQWVGIVIMMLSKALLSLMALSGALLIATNQAIQMVEKKLQRQPGQVSTFDNSLSSDKVDKIDKAGRYDAAISEYVKDNPNATLRQVGEAVGCSRQTVLNWKNSR